MSEQTFIIVGASLAGAKAAETLREQGFEGRVVLIGSESQRPYQRPPLSKDYLRGDAGLDRGTANISRKRVIARFGHQNVLADGQIGPRPHPPKRRLGGRPTP